MGSIFVHGLILMQMGELYVASQLVPLATMEIQLHCQRWCCISFFHLRVLFFSWCNLLTVQTVLCRLAYSTDCTVPSHPPDKYHLTLLKLFCEMGSIHVNIIICSGYHCLMNWVVPKQSMLEFWIYQMQSVILLLVIISAHIWELVSLSICRKMVTVFLCAPTRSLSNYFLNSN